MGKPNAVFRPVEGAAAVRATMGNGIRHLPEQFGIKPSLETRNTAHIDLLNTPRSTLALLFLVLPFPVLGYAV